MAQAWSLTTVPRRSKADRWPTPLTPGWRWGTAPGKEAEIAAAASGVPAGKRLEAAATPTAAVMTDTAEAALRVKGGGCGEPWRRPDCCCRPD